VTAPLEHGYPDYGRFTAQQDIRILSVVNTDLDTFETHPMVFTGHIPYLYMLAASAAQHMSFSFTWFADLAGAIIIQSQTIDVRAGDTFDGTIPNFGPFVQVTVSSSAANGSYGLDLISSNVPKRTPNAGHVGNLLLRVTSQSIGAGATRTDVINTISPGPATWSVDTNVADWFSEIEAIDQAGTTYLIDRLEEKAGNQRRLIFLPPCSVRVRTGNNTAAAGTFYITVGVPPFIDRA
jgi:hypothetical protein